MADPRSEYEIFGGALVRYLGENLPRAAELLCLTDCEPLGVDELLSICPDLDGAFRCERSDYLDGGVTERLRALVAGGHETIAPHHVLLANGAGHALLAVMQALLRPGDHVIVHVPAFPPLQRIPEVLGCELTRWPGDPARGWEPPLDFLADQLRERTRLVIVSFPHNPTGWTPSGEYRRELVEIARRRGVHLLCDEVYATDTPSMADVYEKALSVGGVSKMLGLPAARIGWAVTRDSTLTAHGDVSTNLLGQIVAVAALSQRSAILARNRAIVRENLAFFRQFLMAHEDAIVCRGPMVGPVLFPALTRGSATLFCKRLLDEHRTLAVPGPILDYDDRHVRIGLGRRRFPVALGRFSDALYALD